jgi:hypothetical protein
MKIQVGSPRDALHRKHRFQQSHCCCVVIRYRGNVFTVLLPSNGCLDYPVTFFLPWVTYMCTAISSSSWEGASPSTVSCHLFSGAWWKTRWLAFWSPALGSAWGYRWKYPRFSDVAAVLCLSLLCHCCIPAASIFPNVDPLGAVYGTSDAWLYGAATRCTAFMHGANLQCLATASVFSWLASISASDISWLASSFCRQAFIVA